MPPIPQEVIVFALIVFLAPLLFVGLLFAWLIPLGYTFKSIVNLIVVPTEFFKIFTNKTMRRNHALEHATVNVIEEQYGPTNLSGIATDDGFLIRGSANPSLIYNAAVIGLTRIQRGEKDLALHKRCGTSIAITNLFTSIVFILFLLITGRANIWTVFLAIALGSLIGPTLGVVTQKYITTRTDLSDVEIVGYVPGFGQIKVLTRDKASRDREPVIYIE